MATRNAVRASPMSTMPAMTPTTPKIAINMPPATTRPLLTITRAGVVLSVTRPAHGAMRATNSPVAMTRPMATTERSVPRANAGRKV